jgi:hypothetical protein
MLENALFIRINFTYFFFILFLRSIDKNDEITAIRSKISLSFSRITLKPGLCLKSVIAIIYLTQDIKSMLSLVF